MAQAINREIESGSFKNWDIEICETDEGCGMFEIRMRGPNDEYMYKHMCATEVAEFVQSTYE